jgi:putative transposase
MEENLMAAERYHSRKRTRLKGFDYSQPGFYFVTICTYRRSCCLGDVVQGEIKLSEVGFAVKDVWNILPKYYPYSKLDGYIIMPNHVHGIIQITEDYQFPGRGGLINPPLQPRHDLSEIIRGFKTWSSRYVHRLKNTYGMRFWQRSFYDHIIRDEDDLYNIRQYIRQNPLKWELDPENTD